MACEYPSLCLNKSLWYSDFCLYCFLQANVMKQWDKSALYCHSYVGHTGTKWLSEWWMHKDLNIILPIGVGGVDHFFCCLDLEIW